MAGRPPSLESLRTELLMEIEALTAESIRNELERARLLRELARLSEPEGRRRAVVAS